ncbi:MAG: helix-turn-helix domain-containing protein [Clostridiales bacterium]|nr:helix-turn-helix domain-containing protein [Clostridiales bacterium]
MFSKNLKYYRLKNNLTKRKLSEISGLTPMAITNYEAGTRTPDMDIIKKLAAALGCKPADFLRSRNSDLKFKHAEFRKNSTFGKERQEFIRECVEEYFDRFFTVVDFLGGEVIPAAPIYKKITLSDDYESNARKLRERLGIAESGPIGKISVLLENKGFLLLELDIDDDNFAGMNGSVNNCPYIVINKNISDQRKRTTIIHELAHLMFAWDKVIDEKEIEKEATKIAGAFLIPHDDVIRELGPHRNSVSFDMVATCNEYGISLQQLVKRAVQCNVINESAEVGFYKFLNLKGWRKREFAKFDKEEPQLFRQLVFRAVTQQEISIQKGAELLNESYKYVEEGCYKIGA